MTFLLNPFHLTYIRLSYLTSLISLHINNFSFIFQILFCLSRATLFSLLASPVCIAAFIPSFYLSILSQAMCLSIFISTSSTVSLLLFHVPIFLPTFLHHRLSSLPLRFFLTFLTYLTRQFLLTVFPEIPYTMLFFISHVLFLMLNPFIQFISFHILPFRYFQHPTLPCLPKTF